MQGYVPSTLDVSFERSRECFESVLVVLDDPQATRQTHAELEERLTVMSRELFRVLLQDHLDLRAAREQRRDDVAGAGEPVRMRVETGHTRALATVFGQVSVQRVAYRAPGAANLYPADAVLNLPAESTPTVCGAWQRSRVPAARSPPRSRRSRGPPVSASANARSSR